ncbi:RimK family alpha-L-glutamate ligase [Streptomyces sp. NPDC020681]|uniref:RimK family alpha-L-glutamate ligase n=1 Tax=Streptomyces sp. NPDC020681 TaxID=3365083 RepID=UPI0037891331
MHTPESRSQDVLFVNGGAFQHQCATSPGLELGDEAEAYFCGIEDIAFAICTGQTLVFDTISGRDLAEFGLIQITTYPRPTATLLSTVSAYLAHRERPPVNSAAISAPTKLYQLMVLAQDDLPVPNTFHLARPLLADSYADLADQLGLPFILKAVNGTGGRLNYLIETEVDFRRYLEDPAHAEVAFLAQQFIPNNGTFRALVLGRDVPIVMHRCSTDGSHLSNTAQGGHATLFDVDTFETDVLCMAVRAAALMGCEVAGVNLVQDRNTRQWYVLEVSSNPAIATGAFAQQKTRAYSAYLRSKLAAKPSVARL